MVAWEAKVDALRAKGDVEREAWAVICLGRSREKVKEKVENILQLERSVKRLGGIVAPEAKVKEVVEDEVVEVELEQRVEEMVKEGKATGARQWLRGFSGTIEVGAI